MTHLPMRLLRDLAEINPRATRISPDETVSFVGMADLDEVAAKNVAETPRRFDEVSKGYTPFQNGDLLAAKITPCWQNGKVGEAVLELERGMGSTEFHVVRPGDDADRRYLLHFLRTPAVRATGTLRMTGSGGQRRVPAKFISDLAVPAPTLAEQHRIAAILDEADALRAMRRAQLTHLDELPHALFNELFEDAASFTTLQEVAHIQGGLQVTGKRNTLPQTAKYLRVANVHRGRLALDEIKDIGLTPKEFDRTRLQKGDLLFVEGHANPDEVGRVARWEGAVPDCVHQNHLIRARVDTSLASPVFVEAWMNSPLGRMHFRRAGKTTSGLNTISSSTVRSAPLPSVPIEHQRSFAEKVTAIRAERDRVAKAFEADEELFSALQYRAFRGEL